MIHKLIFICNTLIENDPIETSIHFLLYTFLLIYKIDSPFLFNTLLRRFTVKFKANF